MYMCGEQGAICELATAPACDRLVSQMWEPQASCACLYLVARCKNSSQPQNKVEAWYPRDACLHPGILVHPVPIGNLLGESLSWDWTGLTDLSVCGALVRSTHAAVGSSKSLSALPTHPFPLSTRNGQCTTSSFAANPPCFMANTQPDLFRIELSFLWPASYFVLFSTYVLYNWQ